MEAFNASDVEALRAIADPGIEIHLFSEIGAVHHGHEEGLRWLRELGDTWGDTFRIEPEAYFYVGEHTLLFYVVHGRGQHSGAEVAMTAAQVVRWRDGLAVHMKNYDRRQDALRDLGVSEDALEPIAP
jgi:hypothetical protein